MKRFLWLALMLLAQCAWLVAFLFALSCAHHPPVCNPESQITSSKPIACVDRGNARRCGYKIGYCVDVYERAHCTASWHWVGSQCSFPSFPGPEPKDKGS